MTKETSKLDLNTAALKRWRTRLKRAMTMIDKLEKQRRRLEARPVAKAPPVETRPPVVPAPPVAAKPYGEVLDEMDHQAKYQPATDDHLDIPGFLRRQDPDPAIEQIRKAQAETKRLKARGRIEKMKAAKRGDLKKMPLTGRAALEAIRAG